MSRTSRIVFFGIVPVLAVAMVGATFATSSDRVDRSLVVYAPSTWSRGRSVPMRLAVFGPDDETEPIRSATVRLGSKTVSVRGRGPCQTLDLSVAVPPAGGERLPVEVRAQTRAGEAFAKTVVALADGPVAAPRVQRGLAIAAAVGEYTVEALPVGGSIAVSDPLPVHFVLRRSGRPVAKAMPFAVRTGGLQSPAPSEIVTDESGVASVLLRPLLGDLHVDVVPESAPARLVLPVRAARPTIHVDAPSEAAPVRSFEVRSQSGARCAYADVFANRAHRLALSAPLRRGVARFDLPAGIAGTVAIQASTHFAERGDAVTVRHAWVGLFLDVSLGQGEDASTMQARFASMDGVKFPPEVLVDGGQDAEAVLRERRYEVRRRAVTGIALCALAEAVFLGRAGFRARRKAREVEDAAARETREPIAHGSDWGEIVAFVVAAAACFAALAAVAGLLP